MLKSDLFFAAGTGFVLGAAGGGLGLAPLGLTLILIPVLAATHLIRQGRFVVILVATFALAGNIYYSADDYFYRQGLSRLEQAPAVITGRVIKPPQFGTNSQTLILEEGASQTKLQVQLAAQPKFAYGDVVEFNGTIETLPDNSYGDYLAKEGIHGLSFFPQAVRRLSHESNWFFEKLYEFEARSRAALNRLLTGRQAAIAGAILFGNREDLDPDLLTRLSASGTFHLTALSGLHIAIIIFGLEPFFLALLGGRKRAGLLAVFTVLALFVALTGFKVSALRAVLMAGVAKLALVTGRSGHPRNAIILAALALTILNPKAPVFDLGFQLSFAATLGIIYLVPLLNRLKFFRDESFLRWRELLAVTLAAQIAVAPIVTNTFGNFSLTALPANVALLVTVPILLGLGFATVITSFILPPLATLFGQGLAFLIDYSMLVINFFAEVKIPFNPNFS